LPEIPGRERLILDQIRPFHAAASE
jgi:hypothetical protein